MSGPSQMNKPHLPHTVLAECLFGINLQWDYCFVTSIPGGRTLGRGNISMERPKNFAFFFFCDVYIPRNYFLSILSWKIAVLVLISEFPAFFLIVWAVISPDFAGQIGVWTDRSLQGRSRKCCCRWLRKCFASSFFKAELSALCLWKRVWSFFIPHNEVFVNLMPSCGLEYLGTLKTLRHFYKKQLLFFLFWPRASLNNSIVPNTSGSSVLRSIIGSRTDHRTGSQVFEMLLLGRLLSNGCAIVGSTLSPCMPRFLMK